MKKLLFIVNPVAGTRRLNKNILEIIMMFSENGYQCQIQTTQPDFSAKDIVEKCGEGKDLIVCCGGDGTLNSTISGIKQLQNKPDLGYIPCGSTNDFANSLELEFDPIDATQNIINHDACEIDIGQFNDKLFVYTASFGIFTKASYNTPRSNKNAFGYFAYVLEGIKEIGDIKSYHLKITSHDKVIEGDYIFGGICNSKQIGGGVVKFGNIAKFNDGVFEVFLMKYPKNASEFTQLILDLNLGNYNSKMIELFSTDEITIETNDKIDWTLDGEFQEGSPVVNVKNLHNHIKMKI